MQKDRQAEAKCIFHLELKRTDKIIGFAERPGRKCDAAESYQETRVHFHFCPRLAGDNRGEGGERNPVVENRSVCAPGAILNMLGEVPRN